MNKIKYFLSAVLLFIVVAGCEKIDNKDTSFVKTAALPDKLAALFNITQDNTGLVTISPNGDGASYYDIFYGDTTTLPARVAGGSSTQHVYGEGEYDVKLVAYNVAGGTTETTQQLTVSFKAPENLEVTAAVDATNNFKLNVSAKADFETLFKVYFGDVADEVPQSFMEGETISHEYAATGTYSVKVVALSGGAATTESVQSIVIVDPVLLPVTFESPTVVYDFANFDGGQSTVIDNPHKGGLNASDRVGKMVKSAGQPWGGSVISLGDAVDFSAGKIFRMKVYSPRVGARVLLKVENATDATISFEKEDTTTVANQWEDLVFDYSAINTTNSYQHIVLIFDNGTQGDGSDNFTFLFDDIRLTNTLPSAPAQIDLPVNFDDPGINYTMTDFGNNQTIDGTDPLNSSNKVKVTTKPAGAETWAGTTVGTPDGFAHAVPFTASDTKMSLRVYSPAVGIPIRLKLEDHTDGTKSVETEVLTTVSGTWETLVFDFSSPATGTPAFDLGTTYDKASVFFDFNHAGDGKIFYWDDLKFVSSGGGTAVLGVPLDFQSTTLDYTFTDFNGGNAVVVDNPSPGGNNTSTKVVRMIKNTGEVYGGSYLNLPDPIDFSVKKTFKMKVYSPRAGAKVLLKVENETDPGISYEQEVTITSANTWEELTFDYSNINAANSYQKIVLIFDLGTVGDGSADFTYYFDDITLN